MEYELSDLATTLIPHAVALANWAIEHNPDIDGHREAYDTSAPAPSTPAGLRDLKVRGRQPRDIREMTSPPGLCRSDLDQSGDLWHPARVASGSSGRLQ